MAKKVGNRYYITEQDSIIGNSISLKLEDGVYKIVDLSDADLKVYDEETQEEYYIRYAWDISNHDPNYGKAFYEK